MATPEGENQIFGKPNFYVDGKPVDEETWRAHVAENIGKEIEALAREEPMLIIEDEHINRWGLQRSLGSSWEVSGLRLDLSRVLPEPSISAIKEEDKVTSGEAAVYEYVLKQGVSPKDVVDAVQNALHPETTDEQRVTERNKY
jgi:hypothetical protein